MERASLQNRVLCAMLCETKPNLLQTINRCLVCMNILNMHECLICAWFDLISLFLLFPKCTEVETFHLHVAAAAVMIADDDVVTTTPSHNFRSF